MSQNFSSKSTGTWDRGIQTWTRMPAAISVTGGTKPLVCTTHNIPSLGLILCVLRQYTENAFAFSLIYIRAESAVTHSSFLHVSNQANCFS